MTWGKLKNGNTENVFAGVMVYMWQKFDYWRDTNSSSYNETSPVLISY